MPIYPWFCPGCEKEVDVIRSFSEFEVPPDTDEAKEPCPGDSTGVHRWVRHLGTGQSLHKGAGWGRGKGFWLLLLASYWVTYVLNYSIS